MRFKKTKGKYSLWRVIILRSQFNFFKMNYFIACSTFLFSNNYQFIFLPCGKVTIWRHFSTVFAFSFSSTICFVKSHNRTAVLLRLLTLFGPEVLTPENDYHCKSLRVFTTDVESQALVEIINTSRYMKSKQGI